ncbi:MAG: putative LPS assembly protein LptD, partial [Haliscomenobacter sp.]
MAKKIKLIDNLVVGGSYNFAADSLRFSPLSVSTTARFF